MNGFKRNIVIFVLLTMILVSCNKRGDRNNPLVLNEIENSIAMNSKLFEFGIDIKSQEDYQYILFYKDGTNEWFNEEKTIWVGANGSESLKRISFIFPEKITPKSLRFDIGLNEYKNNKPIVISGGYAKYKNKTIDFNAKQFRQYFKENEFILYDSIKDEYHFKKNNENRFDPFFESTNKIDSLLYAVMH